MGTNSSAPPVRRTQADRVAESAQRLLDAAVELIAEQGFERTTASEIGVRAGLSRDMVRVRYGSKEALLESLLQTDYTRRMLPPDSFQGLPQILDWIEGIRDQVRSETQLIRAFYTLFFEAAGPVPSLRPWCQKWFARCESVTANALRDAQQAGVVRGDLDATTEATRFVSSGVGLGFRWLVDSDTEAFDDALGEWRAHFEALRL